MNEFDHEPERIESEETALAQVVASGDPEMMLAHMEKKAALADRMRKATEHILMINTYPADWTVQGDKACLSSAGAERVGRQFPIRYDDVQSEKETFTDAHGEGYRFNYWGYAELYDRRVYVHGSYSTRDKFLGFAGGEWRTIEEINEGHIRNAAYHVFCGNAIKELLGLRGMPVAEYQRIMGATGRDAAKSGTVSRGSGTRGGSSGDDHLHQKELGEICVEIANAAKTVERDGDDYTLVPLSDADDREALEIASSICETLSGFDGKDGYVKGKASAKALKGKWLNATLGKARKLRDELAKGGV